MLYLFLARGGGLQTAHDMRGSDFNFFPILFEKTDAVTIVLKVLKKATATQSLAIPFFPKSKIKKDPTSISLSGC